MRNLPEKAKRKILFLAPSAYPVGGVATWLSYVLPGLQNLGWNPVLALASGKMHDVQSYLQVHPSGDIRAFENPTGSREGRAKAICSLIKKEKPHLVVSVNIGDSFAAVARLRSRGQEFHFCMSLHGLEECYQKDILNHGNLLDAVVVTNRLTREIVHENTSYPPGRILYAPYGVDVSHQLKMKPPHKSAVKIGYCGRLSEAQKRVSDISPILGHLERIGLDYRLLVAGGGPEEKSLREKLSGPGFDGKIRFLGNLTQSGLHERFYNNIDVLLITSEWETGPIVAWEAMSNGVPLVSSRFRGHVEEGVLKSGDNCLLFDIGDCQAAAGCILELQRNPALTSEIRQNASQLVRSRYSIGASVSAWDEAFHQILRMPPRPVPPRPPRLPGSGRLDSLLGSQAGEAARKWLSRSFSHSDPGSEWPHSYS